MKRNLLVADVGGTRSRFAHFTEEDGRVLLERTLHLSTKDVSTFAELMQQVRAAWPETFHSAVLAVAGPVAEGQRYVRLANVPWTVDLDAAAPYLPDDTRLLNDFTAQGWACLCAEHQDLLELTPHVPAVPPGSHVKAVLGAGTGLGFCALLPGPRVLSSEGGHAPFPMMPDEADYARFVLSRGGRLDGDHLLSGRGLAFLHAYHCGEDLPPPEVAKRMHPLVLEWFARFYGRMAQGWSLLTMSTGGFYITGGIAAANPAIVHHPAFYAAYLDCPTYEKTLRAIPLYLVRNTDAALWGAGLFGAFGARI